VPFWRHKSQASCRAAYRFEDPDGYIIGFGGARPQANNRVARDGLPFNSPRLSSERSLRAQFLWPPKMKYNGVKPHE